MAYKSIISIEFGKKDKRVSYEDSGKLSLKSGIGYSIHNFRDLEKLKDAERKSIELERQRPLDVKNFDNEIAKAIKSKDFKTDSAIFHQLTKKNLYLVKNKEWIKCDKLGNEGKEIKFNYEGNYSRYLKFFENYYFRQMTGFTLDEIKSEAIEIISRDKKREPLTKISKIKKMSSLNEINKYLSKEGVEKIIPLNESYRPSREIDLIDFFKGTSKKPGRQVTTEFIFGVSDSLFIKKGYYRPIYDASKSKVKIKDPRFPEKEVEYWGVDEKSIDYEKFEALGQAYIDHLNSFKEKKHGKLPEGKKHVISAVWHFDEKTPHLHVEVSNFSYKVHRSGDFKEKLTLAPSEEFSSIDPVTGKTVHRGDIKPFRESVWRMLNEKFFPELEREVEMSPEKENKLADRKKWNEELIKKNDFDLMKSEAEKALGVKGPRSLEIFGEIKVELSSNSKLDELQKRIKQEIINHTWDDNKYAAYKVEWKDRGGDPGYFDYLVRLTFYEVRTEKEKNKSIKDR